MAHTVSTFRELSAVIVMKSLMMHLGGVRTCRSEAAKASWELLSLVLNWEQMLLASLAALRLSMASCATLRFHSAVTDGGLTHVMRWMIWGETSVSRHTTHAGAGHYG